MRLLGTPQVHCIAASSLLSTAHDTILHRPSAVCCKPVAASANIQVAVAMLCEAGIRLTTGTLGLIGCHLRKGTHEQIG